LVRSRSEISSAFPFAFGLTGEHSQKERPFSVAFFEFTKKLSLAQRLFKYAILFGLSQLKEKSLDLPHCSRETHDSPRKETLGSFSCVAAAAPPVTTCSRINVHSEKDDRHTRNSANLPGFQTALQHSPVHTRIARARQVRKAHAHFYSADRKIACSEKTACRTTLRSSLV